MAHSANRGLRVLAQLLVLTTLALVLSMVGATTQAVAAPGTIQGTVRAAGTGDALVGVYVQSYIQNALGDWVSSGFVTTGVDGTYELSGLDPGTHRVFFYDSMALYLSEYYGGSPTDTGATPIPVQDGQTVTGIDANLALAGHVSGVVTAADGGAPVPDVQVMIYVSNAGVWEPSGAFATTDADGLYDIGGLETGLYRVKFVDPSLVFAPEYYMGAFSILGAQTLLVTAPGTTPDINAELTAGGHVTGTVTAAEGGAPIEGVAIWAYQNVVGEEYEWFADPVYTDVDGNYDIAGLPSGDYVISFDGAGQYSFYSGKYTFETATRVPVTRGSDNGEHRCGARCAPGERRPHRYGHGGSRWRAYLGCKRQRPRIHDDHDRRQRRLHRFGYRGRRLHSHLLGDRLYHADTGRHNRQRRDHDQERRTRHPAPGERRPHRYGHGRSRWRAYLGCKRQRPRIHDDHDRRQRRLHRFGYRGRRLHGHLLGDRLYHADTGRHNRRRRDHDQERRTRHPARRDRHPRRHGDGGSGRRCRVRRERHSAGLPSDHHRRQRRLHGFGCHGRELHRDLLGNRLRDPDTGCDDC